ncbi:hypothetical protein MRX96_028107 [Rhipicephalus microplus]
MQGLQWRCSLKGPLCVSSGVPLNVNHNPYTHTTQHTFASHSTKLVAQQAHFGVATIQRIPTRLGMATTLRAKHPLGLSMGPSTSAESQSP